MAHAAPRSGPPPQSNGCPREILGDGEAAGLGNRTATPGTDPTSSVGRTSRGGLLAQARQPSQGGGALVILVERPFHAVDGRAVARDAAAAVGVGGDGEGLTGGAGGGEVNLDDLMRVGHP